MCWCESKILMSFSLSLSLSLLSLSLHSSCSYDVIFTAGADVILKKFQDFKSRVVFSAEGFCWPDKSLAVSFFRANQDFRNFVPISSEMHAL